MTQQEAIQRLSRFESGNPSSWRSYEQKILAAKKDGWLNYSRKIAVKIAMEMVRQNMSREDLAEKLGCSAQYVSKLLKGEVNLSLDDICGIENALNIPILQYEFA